MHRIGGSASRYGAAVALVALLTAAVLSPPRPARAAGEARAPGEAREGKAVELNSIRLYVPTPEIERRLGTKDATAISEYIKSLAASAGGIVGAQASPPAAMGLLLAVGLKPGKKVKVWCESVDGAAPEALLRKLEADLAKRDPIDVKEPFAFALELKLLGRQPEKFPEFPKLWTDAAQKAAGEKKDNIPIVPPDELFKIIWPDEK